MNELQKQKCLRFSGQLLITVLIAFLPIKSMAQGDGDAFVDVHQAKFGISPLWYRVGQVRGTKIEWSDSAQFDTGTNPAVAVEGGTVVEVHQAQIGVGPLWYRVGQIQGTKIEWGNSAQYDTGMKPAIAIRNGKVVVTHQAQAPTPGSGNISSLWYRVGKINGLSIQWGNSAQFENGVSPAID
jgi:hypothetical protein